MGREKRTIKIWRETLDAAAKAHNKGLNMVSARMGMDQSWLSKRMLKGYGEFSMTEILALTTVIGCTEAELTAVPVSENTKAVTHPAVPVSENTKAVTHPAVPVSENTMDDVVSEIQALNADVSVALKELKKDRASATKQDELYEMIRAVAKMLHNDMVNLLEAVRGGITE